MELLSYVALIGWLPVSLALFARMPPRRAVATASIAAWLFLPVARVPLPGVPDLTKASVPMVGLLIGIALYDAGKLHSLRVRWFDVPILIWCVAPFVSSITNDLGPYDGLSSFLEQAITWGLPYLIGRIYLNEPEGLKQLAVAIIAGGVVYVPFCLFEIRMSPQLHRMVYGFSPSAFSQTIRYGGYRPQVFMTHGLELGMWMTSASLLGWYLWSRGELRRLWGLPFGGVVLPVLIGTTILCKSSGSLILLAMGIAILWAIRRTGSSLFVWALVAVAPIYVGVRVSGIWDGRSAVEIADQWMGGDRARSLEFRLDNEDILIAKAMQRPVFGWAGWGRGRVFDDEGKDLSVTDGLWIIALGNYGIFGLVGMTATILTPIRLLLGRGASRARNDRALASPTGLAILLGLFAIDNLSNAMFNPIFILAAGGLASLDSRQAGETSSLMRLSDRAEVALVEAIGLDEEADAHRDLSRPSEAAGLVVESDRAWAASLALMRVEFEESSDRAERRRILAFVLEKWSRRLVCLGHEREALQARAEAIELRAELAAEARSDPEATQLWADVLNDTAWLLAVAVDPAVRDPSRAIELARAAVERFPRVAIYWNTLGAAHLRAGEWPMAAVALRRSMTLSQGGTCFDHLLMSLVLLGRGDVSAARVWFERGVASMAEDPVRTPGLTALVDEAAGLLRERTP